jgi:RNA polymerase sigma factor (sigma-70 family)
MDPRELFEANLALIDRVAAGVCRRAHVYGADAEDFASSLRVALMENDYAILRSFGGRSSLSTFLIVIAQRLLSDERTKVIGRWHPSREAERMGEAGIALERIIRRDQRTIDEALPIVCAIDPALTRERLVEMESRLPARAPRPRAVGLEIVDVPAAHDDRALAIHADRMSDRASSVIRMTLAAMELEDRMIIKFHFGSSLTIADISGLLRLPQRPLYRRMDSLLKRLRAALVAEGIEGRDVADVIGSATREMNLGLTNGESSGARRTNVTEVG